MERLIEALKHAQIEYRTDLSLAAHSTFRIGGRAELAILPKNKAELMKALELIRQSGLSVTVIGKASNVVFPDGNAAGIWLFTSGCRSFSIDGDTVYAEAGAPLSAIASAARDASLEGAEFAHGIPGTLGGAVFMNAGAFGGCMADICIASEYYDMESGTVGVMQGEEQGFGTRQSVYTTYPSYVILGATLQLRAGDRNAIADSMKDFMERRRASQPLEYPSAGSVFKRPEGHFAGKLIEDCGLKGMRIGGAEVSVKHAGFIINRGGATARDVRELTDAVRAIVLERTGVNLECEIRFL